MAQIRESKSISINTISDAIEALRSIIPEEELNHKDSAWVILGKNKKGGTTEIAKVFLLSDSDVFLNQLHCKELLQIALLNDTDNILLLYNRPLIKIQPNNSERGLAKYLKDITKFIDISLWDVVIMNKETYYAYI